jgi:hypothetical protein
MTFFFLFAVHADEEAKKSIYEILDIDNDQLQTIIRLLTLMGRVGGRRK